MTNPLTWTTERRKLSDLVPWPRNPRQIRKDEAARLSESLDTFGQVDTIAIGPNSEVYNGHQRVNVWAAEHGDDFEVEVRVASRELSEKEREKLTVFLHRGAAGDWDFDILANEFELDELLEWGFEESDFQLDWGEDDNRDLLGVPKDAKPNPRNLPIDVIYTLQMADCTCCLAVQAGWKYGIQSAQYRLCPYVGQLSGRHKVEFIDNDYFHYDHAIHLAAVRDIRPKYTTALDVMTKEQCAQEGTSWQSLEKTLDEARELAEYAENVIVIPKYDCLDRIPAEFILGYSVPTSHGGTPLPVEAFKGRRIHLLGGSWKAQLAHMAALSDDVVSLDNNQVQKIAREFGSYVTPEGETQQMQGVGYGYLTNVRYAALAMSFGAIGSKVNELYAGSATPGE